MQDFAPSTAARRGATMGLADLKELSDKDLIKRFCSNPSDKDAGEELFGRCLPKIRKFIGQWGSKHLYHLPRTVDRQGFLNDAESLAGEKLRRNICSYAFRGSFDGWVRRVAVSAAATEYLEIVGRGPQPRDFVPLDVAFRSKHWPSPFEHVRDLGRHEIFETLLKEHAKSSDRNLKSANAIALSAWEGYEANEIAKILDTTQAYVWSLRSHDYGELREIFVQKFGITSTEQI